ncbi:hypothetical protein [uncultured Winogradskyella sp.]|uniref:hypothetical protein n=1 Tax=uncultured Winogradskyella sp. TaxID=395353 RepID=UPI00260B8F34|nr:hypothetical protein [uncultured Winogradskyella sp.]
MACDAPEGYVAESGDCGCGVEEDTCNNEEPEICDAPEFDFNTVYNVKYLSKV